MRLGSGTSPCHWVLMSTSIIIVATVQGCALLTAGCYRSYIVPESLFSTLNITEDGLTHTWMCAGGPSFVMLGQIVLEHLYSAYNCAFLPTSPHLLVS